MLKRMKVATLLVAIVTVLAVPSAGAQGYGEPEAEIAKLRLLLNRFLDERREADKNLATFDDLDFNVFSSGRWGELHKSHDKDVIVHWPDGRVTEGIDVHIEDLKSIFVWAPDSRILVHPIKIAAGDWTAVSGVFEGTFTNPMPLPNGTYIGPTGKAFKVDMATLGHWKNGVMIEEFLFWDNAAINKQLGLEQ